jgi:hypothetical protein
VVGLKKYGYVIYTSEGQKLIYRHKDQISVLNELHLLARGRPEEVTKEFDTDRAPEEASEPARDENADTNKVVEKKKEKDSPFPKKTLFEETCAPDMKGPPSSRLKRDRQPTKRYAVLAEVAEVIKETCATEGEAVDMINTLIYTYAPDAKGMKFIDKMDEADEAIRQIYAERKSSKEVMLMETTMAECLAVEKKVLITTDLGEQEMIIPASIKDIMKNKHRDGWLESLDRAIRVQLAAGQNYLLRESDIPKGEPLVKAVFPRTVKKDKVTNRMLPDRGFYTRMGVDGAEMKRKYERRGRTIQRPDNATTLDPITVNLAYEHAARHKCDITAIDVPNAYAQGDRLRPPLYVELPQVSQYAHDEDGEKMCMVFCGPGQGEIPAGDEWYLTADRRVEESGWQPAENVPNVYTARSPGAEVPDIMLMNVDEFLVISMPGSPFKQKTIDFMRKIWGSNPDLGDIKVKHEPNEFLSREHFRDKEKGILTWYKTAAIEKAVLKHLPDIEKTRPSQKLTKGTSFRMILDALELVPSDKRNLKLNAMQKIVQRKIGDLKFPEDAAPECSLAIHKLSACNVYPPPGADFAADLVLEKMWDARFGGNTYGGDGIKHNDRLDAQYHGELDLDKDQAPDEPEMYGDSTWQLERDRYGTAFVKGGGLIKSSVKFIRTITNDPMDSSCIAESVPTSKCSEDAEIAAETLRAFGCPIEEPIVICTDSMSNGLLANRQQSMQRLKHAARRYAGIHKRRSSGVITVRHIGDASMPVDFLTKWVPAAKLENSIEFLTNRYNKIHHPRDPKNPNYNKKAKA